MTWLSRGATAVYVTVLALAGYPDVGLLSGLVLHATLERRADVLRLTLRRPRKSRAVAAPVRFG